MKKYGVIVVAIGILVGCSNSSFSSFKGESTHWEASYKMNATETSEDGEYVFHFKNSKNQSSLKQVKISISDHLVQQEKKHHGNTIRIPNQCSGCSITDKSQPIPIAIDWNGKSESFELMPQ